jgi:hypothetical protein
MKEDSHIAAGEEEVSAGWGRVGARCGTCGGGEPKKGSMKTGELTLVGMSLSASSFKRA